MRLLAPEHPQHLGRHLHGHRASGLRRDPRHVRADDDIGQVQQRVVGGDRLLLEHVEAGGADLAAAEALEERVLLLGLAAGGVDEDHPVLHLRDGLAVDHVMRLGRVRRVAGHDVRLAQDRVQIG